MMRISSSIITIGIVGSIAAAGVAFAQRPSHPPVTPEWTYKQISKLEAENQSLRNDLTLLGNILSAEQKRSQAFQKEYANHMHWEMMTTINGSKQNFLPRPSSVPSKYCTRDASKPGLEQVTCNPPK